MDTTAHAAVMPSIHTVIRTSAVGLAALALLALVPAWALLWPWLVRRPQRSGCVGVLCLLPFLCSSSASHLLVANCV